VSEKWTPEQFWEYVEGLAGDFNAGQMRDMLAERGLSLAAPETKKPSFRSEVFQAAERANKRFGQWMPQQWLEIFIGEMMKEPE